MYLKSKQKLFKVSILQLAPCLHCYSTEMRPPRQESQEGAALTLTLLALYAPTAGLFLPNFFLPNFFLSILKKHYSIFMSKSWLVWFVSLEPSIKEATFSCYFYSCLSIRAAISFDSSVAHRLTWPNGLMNACIRTAYCYQNGMWEYAMHLRLRNDQEIKI